MENLSLCILFRFCIHKQENDKFEPQKLNKLNKKLVKPWLARLKMVQDNLDNLRFHNLIIYIFIEKLSSNIKFELSNEIFELPGSIQFEISESWSVKLLQFIQF